MSKELPKFVIHFTAFMISQGGKRVEKAIFLHECPKNIREGRKIIAKKQIEDAPDDIWILERPYKVELFSLKIVL